MGRYGHMALVAWVALGGAARAQEGRLAGPFVADSLAFFIVHEGGPLEVRLEVSRTSAEVKRQGNIGYRHAVYWQLFDAEERLVNHEYARFDDATELAMALAAEPADAPAGIYQVRATVPPGTGMSVDLQTEPAAPFGIMPRRCRLHEGSKGQFSEAYLYVPEGCDALKLNTYAASVTVRDGGRTIGEAKGGKAAEVEVTAGQVYGVALAFDWEGGGVGINGAPPILCPSEEVAERIAGSVEETADGRKPAHRFQVRMWEWMQGLSEEDLRVEAEPLEPLLEHWLQDPRNAGLLGQGGPFNHIARILQDQDQDPKSETYGLGTETAWLGPAFVIEEPLNPYRRKREILNRLVLHEFAWFLKLGENGTLDANDWNHYGGGDGLFDGPRFFQFGYVAPHIDEELRELWLEGVSHLISRWVFDRVSCENQTSSRMWNLEMLHLGSGEEIYQTLAREFARDFYSPELNGFFETGYHQERYGPDATYNGLCASNQAAYYRHSGDELAREGLRKTYDLFNHTVAPEPNGRMLGASNFSHRTSGSWVQRQWNGGVRLMSGELPEAGVWYAGEDPGVRRAKALEDIKQGLAREYSDDWYEQYMRWVDSYAYHPWTRFFTEYMFPPETVAEGTWPVLASERFTKLVNNEFVFMRRPGYYAAVYIGDTSSDWVRASIKPEPCLEGWELTEGVFQPTDANSKKLAWQPTQGLSMLWTPEYGSCILGANWNVYTGQLVRADLADGKVSWPDYWELEKAWDAEAETLTLTQRMFDLPISVTRRMAFEEEGLRQTVEVAREEGVEVERLVEQLPYVRKEGAVVLMREGGEWVEAEEATTNGVWVGDGSGQGVRFTFAAPVSIRKGLSSRNHGFELGLLEIELDRAVSYLMEPVAREDL